MAHATGVSQQMHAGGPEFQQISECQGTSKVLKQCPLEDHFGNPVQRDQLKGILRDFPKTTTCHMRFHLTTIGHASQRSKQYKA